MKQNVTHTHTHLGPQLIKGWLGKDLAQQLQQHVVVGCLHPTLEVRLHCRALVYTVLSLIHIAGPCGGGEGQGG